jgi:hypothetical protein
MDKTAELKNEMNVSALFEDLSGLLNLNLLLDVSVR